MKMQHLAQQLCFDIRFAGRELAEEQQQALCRFASQRAPLVIEAVFVAASDARTLWRLERLEVDLGQVFADEMEVEWERRLSERLHWALQERQHDERPSCSDESGMPTRQFGPRSIGASAFQDLCRFLELGVLPWDRGESGDPVARLVQASLRHHGAELSRWLAVHPHCAARLAAQCPEVLGMGGAEVGLPPTSALQELMEHRERFLTCVDAAAFGECARLIPQLLRQDCVWLRRQLFTACASASQRRGLLHALSEDAWRALCELSIAPRECEQLLTMLAHPVLQSVADALQWREHVCCAVMLTVRPPVELAQLFHRSLLHVASSRAEPVGVFAAELIQRMQRQPRREDELLLQLLNLAANGTPRGTLDSHALVALRERLLAGLAGTSGQLPTLLELELLEQQDASWLRAVLTNAGRDPEQRRRCAQAWDLTGWQRCAPWWMAPNDVAALCSLLTHPRVLDAAPAVELCDYAWRCAALAHPASSVHRSQLAALLGSLSDTPEQHRELIRLTQAMLSERPPAEMPAVVPLASNSDVIESPVQAVQRALARWQLLDAIDVGVAAMPEAEWRELWRWLVAADSAWLRHIISGLQPEDAQRQQACWDSPCPEPLADFFGHLDACASTVSVSISRDASQHCSAATVLAVDLARRYSDQTLAELLAPWYSPAQCSAWLVEIQRQLEHSGQHDTDVIAFRREQLWTQLITYLWSGTVLASPVQVNATGGQGGTTSFEAGAAVVTDGLDPPVIGAKHALVFRELQAILKMRGAARGAASRDEPAHVEEQVHLPETRPTNEFPATPASETPHSTFAAPHASILPPPSLRDFERAEHATLDAQRIVPGPWPRQPDELRQVLRAALETPEVGEQWFAVLTDSQRTWVLQTLLPFDHWIIQRVVRTLLAAWSAGITPLSEHEQRQLAWRFIMQECCVEQRLFEIDASVERLLEFLGKSFGALSTSDARAQLARGLRMHAGTAEMTARVVSTDQRSPVRDLRSSAGAGDALPARIDSQSQPAPIAGDVTEAGRVAMEGSGMGVERAALAAAQIAAVTAGAAIDTSVPEETSRAIANTSSDAARKSHSVAVDQPPATHIAVAVRTVATELAQALATLLERSSTDALASTDNAVPEVRVGEALYLDNAGMVLAAPYLPRLFEMLGLMREGAFLSSAASERAVHLVQFLVNEAAGTPEHRLPLNKLLCGLSLVTPVCSGIELSVEERSTIEQLLAAMIQHWKILGSTSVAGLRETFLQREGRLTRMEDHWHLLVEPRPFDMLLDQLPWGYATIKYSWMEQVLHVQWR